MNERIQELIARAEMYADEQNKLYGVSYSQTLNEKLAELIIKEIVQGTLMRASWYDRKVDGKIVTMVSVVDLAKLIQKEFGVEE